MAIVEIKINQIHQNGLTINYKSSRTGEGENKPLHASPNAYGNEDGQVQLSFSE
jgi:hypothetical protein